MFTTKTFYNSKDKIWHGKTVAPLFDPHISIGEVILNSLQRNPNKVSQISIDNETRKESRLTQNELRILTIRFAQFLQYHGIKQNDVVGVIGSNSKYMPAVVFGSFLCGTPVNALDSSFQKDDILHMFNITKPKIIFCDLQNYDDVKKSIEEINLKCEIFLLTGQINGIESVENILVETGRENHFTPPKLIDGGDQTAVILCSSGTTGLSKGVCTSHKTMLLRSIIPNIRSDDILFSFSPLYWATGYFMLCTFAIQGATRIVVDAPFSVERFFYIFKSYENITVFLSPPSQLAQIIKDSKIKTTNFSTLRIYKCCGSLLSEPLRHEIKTYLPADTKIVNGYGMSEVLGFCTAESEEYNKYETTGQIVENFEFKIINEDNQNLGANELGEIVVRTIEKWAGYYGNYEATKTAMDADGWIYSGDLGYFDDEGYLYVIDRKKNILKHKGFHIYPNEIESFILKNIPDIIEVAVCGIYDVELTDLPAAAIVLKKNSSLKEQDIYEYVAKNMVDYKLLRGGVYFLKSLPKTASGKVQKRIVKEIVTKLYNSKNNEKNVK